MVRVYDLATAFRLTTKEVLERLSAGGVEATTFGSSVDEVRAREVLSQPVARIPARTMRPGSGTTPAKPAPKRAARPKTKAAAGESPEAAQPAPRRRTATKVGEEGEAKPTPKPRAPRKRAAVVEAKPLLVTLEAPTVEPVAAAPVLEPPPLPAEPPATVPVVPIKPAAPPPLSVVEPVAPAAAREPVVWGETPSPLPAEAPLVEKPRPVTPPLEAAPPPPRPAPPRPGAPRKPAPPVAEGWRADQELPRPAVEPPRPVVAEGQAPDLGALESAAPSFLAPEPEVAAPSEVKAPARAPAPPPPPKPAPPAPPAPKILKVGEALTPKALAERMSAATSDVIKRLIKLGVLATINTPIDLETVGKVAQQFGYSVEQASPEEMVAEITEVEDPRLVRPRAPVVTVMGHVDHGKTSLLDAIRHTNVIATEAGGITQHIGAYEVEVPGHAVDRVVFLDTPGHEAFTAMRARGAQATDIVVLVVAADDGVMPQTIEAINHAKDAKVPILVAINKIDKADADPNRIKQQLAEYNLVPEEWGGETIFVAVSAKRREGIENLLDNLLVLAEVQELKANPDKPARGLVVEAELDKGRGPVATVLVQAGSLRVGDVIVAGFHHGRVRAMVNDKGRKIGLAGPATPVEILGLSGVPLAGDTFAAVGDERKARQIALARQEKHRQETMVSQPRTTLDALHQQIQQGEVKDLRMILKGDVQGSVEPLRDSLERLGTEQVKVRVIHSSVGAITESDIMLASASNAIIVGFNVRPEPKAQRLAEQERVDVRLYTVIYDAIKEVRAAMEGLLEPQLIERPLGRVEVRQAFNISKVGTIAGSFVVDGKVTRDASVRLVRDGRVIFTGKIASLRRFKDDVREVQSGLECGIGLVNYNDIHQGDILEAYEVEEVAPKL
ncbi:MAG: translation initiation factor IF-2 [candidate division NC10 bacterium]|nr:translation initiation factor IF-2 [candidate division NC10 bacterium]